MQTHAPSFVWPLHETATGVKVSAMGDGAADADELDVDPDMVGAPSSTSGSEQPARSNPRTTAAKARIAPEAGPPAFTLPDLPGASRFLKRPAPNHDKHGGSGAAR